MTDDASNVGAPDQGENEQLPKGRLVERKGPVVRIMRTILPVDDIIRVAIDDDRHPHKVCVESSRTGASWFNCQSESAAADLVGDIFKALGTGR